MIRFVPTWKILDRGRVPANADVVPFECPRCGAEADLPVLGKPMAQLSDGGWVFHRGPRALPALIQCRQCRREFESD
jgi:hypothetical protein